MYQVKQPDEKINTLLNRCAESEETGESKYPGMTFEQGIKMAIEWLTGLSPDHPLDE